MQFWQMVAKIVLDRVLLTGFSLQDQVATSVKNEELSYFGVRVLFLVTHSKFVLFEVPAKLTGYLLLCNHVHLVPNHCIDTTKFNAELLR